VPFTLLVGLNHTSCLFSSYFYLLALFLNKGDRVSLIIDAAEVELRARHGVSSAVDVS
jgi:hypothetical protein